MTVSKVLATEETGLPIYIDPSDVQPPSPPVPVWSCGPVHVDGDDLVLERESATTYRIADKPQIHLRFAAIKTVDDAVDFASEFGLLYHGALPLGTVPDSVTAALLKWRDEDKVREPREPYTEMWVPEVARINRIISVYKLVSGPRWGDAEFIEMLELWQRSIRSDLRGVPAPKDPQEAIYLGGLYVCWMTNDWFDRTRFILDLGLTESENGEVARPTFDLAMESPITLLGYIYFRLAQEFARSARFGRCPECGRVFKTETGDRRKYDTRQCSQRARYHRHVKRNPGYRKIGS